MRKRRSEQHKHEEKQKNNPITEALSGDSSKAFTGEDKKVEHIGDDFL